MAQTNAPNSRSLTQDDRAECGASSESGSAGLPSDYVLAVANVANLLEEARLQIAGKSPEEAGASLNARYESVLPRWRESVKAAASAALQCRAPPELFKIAQAHTQKILLPMLLSGPIWRRSYDKPRGYPGDFGILNFVYDELDSGDDAHALLCHRLGMDVGACVRTRMQMVATELVTLLRVPGEELLVLSLGCGSSREVARALEADTAVRGARFVLIDQDHDALASARSFIAPLAERHGDKPVRVEYVRLSFGQMLGDSASMNRWGKQDLAYCIGLLDYLEDEQLDAVVDTLMSLLKPGGLLILGNMKNPSPTFWPLDFILDWHLVYRTDAQMKAIARRQDVQKFELALEATGNNFILKIWKAA